MYLAVNVGSFLTVKKRKSFDKIDKVTICNECLTFWTTLFSEPIWLVKLKVNCK